MGICIKEALRRITKEVQKVSFEILPIENANKKISAQDIYVKHSLPPFNNSAMDGYAIRLADIGKEVKVIDDIFAGSEKETQIEDGQCVKIMTGARVPKSAQAIV
ncbi:MAG: molybdopterin molybdenumtransferase MoeA, partial [Campylobacterota bacterium]|nr:molybdopterin molybdenumtransferase MoeA [Campylobacterota bacterium]